MAFTEFDYSRKWTSADPETGFKTYEDREDKVRADMQFCFDEVRDALNDLGDYVDSGDVPVSVDADDVSFTPTAYINEDNVQDAIENVQAQIVAWMTDHVVTPNTVTGAMMVEGAVDTRELHDDAVTGDKIDDGAVDYNHLATDSVRRDAIMDGEVTDAKIENGAPYNKADLITEGGQKYVAKSQSCLRRNNIILYGADNYTLSNNDMMNYIKLTADTAGGMPVYVPYDATIAVGSYCFLECVSGVSEIRPGSGVTLRVNGLDTVSSYAIREAGETLLVIKLASGEWMILPYRHKVITDDLANGAVTYEKTVGVQEAAKVVANVYVPTNTGWFISNGAYRYWKTTVAREDSLSFNFAKTIAEPFCNPANEDASAKNHDIIIEKQIYLAGITDSAFVFHARYDPRTDYEDGVRFNIIGF